MWAVGDRVHCEHQLGRGLHSSVRGRDACGYHAGCCQVSCVCLGSSLAAVGLQFGGKTSLPPRCLCQPEEEEGGFLRSKAVAWAALPARYVVQLPCQHCLSPHPRALAVYSGVYLQTVRVLAGHVRDMCGPCRSRHEGCEVGRGEQAYSACRSGHTHPVVQLQSCPLVAGGHLLPLALP